MGEDAIQRKPQCATKTIAILITFVVIRSGFDCTESAGATLKNIKRELRFTETHCNTRATKCTATQRRVAKPQGM